jgi:NAD(P)-dependent dehydrogenase (short-subunit alcohol dehydrogenase family)
VVNIASILGLDAEDIFPIYSGTKHGVVGLTKAFGVRDSMCTSNNVAPIEIVSNEKGRCRHCRQVVALLGFGALGE